MNFMKLLTGASGLLGRHLKGEYLKPSHEQLDITKKIHEPLFGVLPKNEIKMVVHAAAYTNVEKAETDRIECFKTNALGTLNLLNLFPTTPFVYISSEYAHNPVNFYSLTKAMGEQLVTTHPSYLIIRTLFKPRPWKYEYAFEDKFTLGDYVDVIAPLIEKEIEQWDGKSKLIYVGTGRKSYYDLALQSKLDVKPNSIRDVKGVKIPADYQ